MAGKIFRSMVFAGILIALLAAASAVTQPKNNTLDSGIHEVLANGYRSEPKDTLDVLFLGDSLVHTSFIPMRFWEDYGITAHICATNAQDLILTEEFLHDFFRTQSPKIVMLEANHFYRTFERTDAIAPAVERLLPVFRYHNRWKSLQKADWFAPVEYTAEIFEKGYYYTGEITPADPGDYMGHAWSGAPLSALCVEYVERIQQFCRENNAQLVLYSVPSAANWRIGRHAAVEELADRLGIPYLDGNMHLEEIGIDWQVDTKDGGDHMNFTGACKVTDYFGSWLAGLNLFPDKRETEAYQHWNDQLQLYHEWLERVRD